MTVNFTRSTLNVNAGKTSTNPEANGSAEEKQVQKEKRESGASAKDPKSKILTDRVSDSGTPVPAPGESSGARGAIGNANGAATVEDGEHVLGDVVPGGDG